MVHPIPKWYAQFPNGTPDTTQTPLKIHLDDARGALEQPPTLSVLRALGVGAAVVLFALALARGGLDLRAREVSLRSLSSGTRMH